MTHPSIQDRVDQLPLVIIVTPQSDRKVALLKSLEPTISLDVIELEATMLKYDSPEFLNPKLVNLEGSKVIYGRSLSPAEYGCAISNSSAREILSRTPFGGIVLEDDARIIDLPRFIQNATNFLLDQQGKSSVLSFFDGTPYAPRLKSFNKMKKPWIKVFGHTSFTVAYAITPQACRKLLEANTPTTFLADWPVTSTKFFLSTEALIKHGDENTKSVISTPNTENRIRPRFWTRLSILSFAYYLKKRKAGLSISTFLKCIWLPRVFWYLSKLKKTALLRQVSGFGI